MVTRDSILVRVHDPVKPRVTRNRNAEIRARLHTRLKALGRAEDYAWIAAETGETRTQIRKWVTGETDSFPAAFAAVLEEAGIVSARYLLTGEGDARVMPPALDSVRVEIVGKVVGDQVDEATLRNLQRALQKPPGEANEGAG